MLYFAFRFVENCDAIHGLSTKCEEFLSGKKDEKIQVDVKKIEEVRKDFKAANIIKGQLCKQGESTSQGIFVWDVELVLRYKLASQRASERASERTSD